MPYSQNGWLVDISGDSQDHAFTVAGSDFPNGVRRGDVATVLGYVARRFHAEVEKLMDPGCWGYYVRPIRGTLDTYSNHSSGTAIDLNAPRHALGDVGTFTPTQVRAIEAILDDCDGVVRWGGHYSERKDEMHFEVVKGPAAVSVLAGKIREEEGDDMTPAELLKYDGVTNLFGDKATNPTITVETALENASRASMAEREAKEAKEQATAAAVGIGQLLARPMATIVLSPDQLAAVIDGVSDLVLAKLIERVKTA